jgi:hypothetical protein
MLTQRVSVGIDPGPEYSAIVVIREYTQGNRPRFDYHGILDNESMRGVLLDLCCKWHSDVIDYGWEHSIGIERIKSYGMPAGDSLLETCVYTGRLLEIIDRAMKGATYTIHRPPRKTVVTHICGVAKGGDSHVRQAMIDRWGEPGRKAQPGLTYGFKGDEWAALAVASWVMDQGTHLK